jgi:hypothetical protein
VARDATEQMKGAFPIWLSSLSAAARRELGRHDLRCMSLKHGLTWDTECSVSVRRAAMVGRLKSDAWLQLRKVEAMCARHARARALTVTGDMATTAADQCLRGVQGGGNFSGLGAIQESDVIGRGIEGASNLDSITISADLDDQNWRHTLWEWEVLWQARATAVGKLGSTASKEHGSSCRFVATRLKRSLVCFEGESCRISINMFTDHYGTTWDNTNDYKIDRQISLADVERLELRCFQFGVGKSGDLELAEAGTREEAAVSSQVQWMMDIHMKAKEQLMGTYCWAKGDDYIEVPARLPELQAAPTMQGSAAAWVAAKHSGYCITEEDNLAALGLANQEVFMLGGSDAAVSDPSLEERACMRPVGKANKIDLDIAVDPGFHSVWAMFQCKLPAFGVTNEDDPPQRTVVVVAAAHGSGISRLARRFRQGAAARFDLVASVWCGLDAYHCGYDGARSRRDVTTKCARMIGGKLKDGCCPELRVLLCHEHPDAIVAELQRCGLRSYWHLYDPGKAGYARRIAMLRVGAGVMRYLQSCLRSQYSLHGNDDRLDSEESVVHVAQVAAVPCCC